MNNRSTASRTAPTSPIRNASKLVLWGPMGVGKSTVGRLVSERLRLEFVDLDAEIERQAGSSISVIFDRQGELAFRDMERAQALHQLSREFPLVVAFGGGTILSQEVRDRCLSAEVLTIFLSGNTNDLAERLSGDATRPMLRSGHGQSLSAETMLTERLAQLDRERSPLYRQADFVIETSGRNALDVAMEVETIWKIRCSA